MIAYRMLRPTMLSLIETFSAGDERVLSQIAIEPIFQRVGTYLNGLPTPYRFTFYSLLGFLHLAQFRRLALSTRVRWIDSASESRLMPLRLLSQGLKFIFLPQIYSDPRLLDSIGYGSAMKRRQLGQC